MLYSYRKVYTLAPYICILYNIQCLHLIIISLLHSKSAHMHTHTRESKPKSTNNVESPLLHNRDYIYYIAQVRVWMMCTLPKTETKQVSVHKNDRIHQTLSLTFSTPSILHLRYFLSYFSTTTTNNNHKISILSSFSFAEDDVWSKAITPHSNFSSILRKEAMMWC